MKYQVHPRLENHEFNDHRPQPDAVIGIANIEYILRYKPKELMQANVVCLRGDIYCQAVT